MTALELIKRLARDLADRVEAYGESTPSEQALLAQARAFLDGAMEVELGNAGLCLSGFTNKPCLVYEMGNAMFFGPKTDDLLEQAGVTPPPRYEITPKTVTIIVRPKGAG